MKGRPDALTVLAPHPADTCAEDALLFQCGDAFTSTVTVTWCFVAKGPDIAEPMSWRLIAESRCSIKYCPRDDSDQMKYRRVGTHCRSLRCRIGRAHAHGSHDRRQEAALSARRNPGASPCHIAISFFTSTSFNTLKLYREPNLFLEKLS